MHSHAKISYPRLEGIYSRERLFTRLDAARRHPVVWVAGPAGSGKTTLAASYVTARGVPTIWLQLDKSDADPATFFHYLGLALKKALPRSQPLPALTPEYLADPLAFARGFFSGLAQRLKGPALVVLDNYQTIPDTSPVHALLIAAQEELNEQQSLLILSRDLPLPLFARLRVSGGLVVIEQDELTLTEEEFAAVMTLMCPDQACEPERRTLYVQTGGWVAGLVLMLQQPDIRHPKKIANVPTTAIFDYFASELFEGVGSELRIFLFKTALLPSFTVEMARSLTGSPDATRHLDTLLRRNLFTTRRGSKEQMNYQYHDLFREFLQVHGQEELGATAYTELRKYAAALLIANGQHEAAVELLITAGDYDALANLVESQAATLARHGRLTTLQQWLAHIPVATYAERPWLSYWSGICRLPFEPLAARNLFTQALEQFVDEENGQGLLLAWAGAVDTFPQAMDAANGLDRYLDLIEELLTRFAPIDHTLKLYLAPRVLAGLLLRRPADPAFEHWRALTFEALNDPQLEPGLRLLSGYYLVVSHIWAGDPVHAHQVVAILKSMSKGEQGTHTLRLTAMMTESWIAALSARRDESFDAMEKALELANVSGVHLWDSMLILIGATVAKTRGELTTAEQMLQRLGAQMAQLRPLDQLYFYHQNAWLALLRGEPVQALTEQRKTLDIAIRLGMAFPLADANLGMMWAMHAVKDVAGRAHYLTEVERLGQQLHSVYLEFMLRFAKAAFALDEGNRDERIKWISALLKLGREHALTGMTWWQPRLASRICATALEEGIEVEYASYLIRLHGLVPDTATTTTITWPYPAHLRTLGGFTVRVDGHLLQTGNKAQKKPLELLTALVALGPTAVSEDRLMDALWPDTDLTQARQNLKTTLHRLRRQIGLQAVRVESGKLSLDTRYIWVDAFALMQLTRDIEAECSAGNEVSAQTLERLFTLYQGEFLPDEYGVWVLQMREGLHIKVLRILERIGEGLLQQDRNSEARYCFERAIEIDPYTEAFYRGLMQSYHRLGRLNEALKVYKRCERLLQEVFGAGCSAETQSLYHAIRQSIEAQQRIILHD